MRDKSKKMPVDEVVINIKHLLFQCLKKSVLILCIAVFASGVLTVNEYLTDYKAYQMLVAEESNNTINLELTQTELATIQSYYLLQSRVEQLKEYSEESIIMQMDFSNVYEVCIQYTIQTDERKKSDIVSALVDYVNNGILSVQMAKLEGMPEAKYLRELVKAECVGSAEGVSSGIVTLHLWAIDDTQGLEFSEIIKALIETYISNLEEHYGSRIVASNQEEGWFRYLGDVYSIQKKTYEETKAVSTEFNNVKASLTEAQKLVIMQNNGQEINFNNKDVLISEPMVSFEDILIRVIIIAVLVMLLIIFYELFSGKMQDSRELYDRLGIQHLADLKLKSNNLTGKLLDKLFFSKETLLHNQRIEFLCEYIRHNFKEEEKTIVLSSTRDKEEAVLSELISTLKDKGVCCEGIVSMAKNPEMFIKTLSGRNIVFIEFIGETKIKEIYEQVEIFERFNVNIMGYVSITK